MLPHFCFTSCVGLNLLFTFLPFMLPPMTRTLNFGDATNKGGELIIEGDEVSFFTNIGRAIAGDDCCAGVAIKSSYHHPRLNFLYTIK